MSTYQQPNTDRGSDRVFTEGPEAERFREAMHGVARKLLFSTTGLSDRQFLYDVLRDRYPGRWLHRLATICATSIRPEHHGLLDEALAGFDAPVNPMSLGIAFDHECEAQAAADVAQREVERFPSAETKATALDRMQRHILALKQAMRSVQAMVIR